MSVMSFDGGGTRGRLAIADSDGHLVHFATGEGVNPLDNSKWQKNLTDLFKTAGGALAAVEMAVIGMPAFGEFDETDRAVTALVSTCLSSARRIVNDVELAHYAAFDGGAGTLILAGTGSMAMTGANEGLRRIGGWGDELGDEGSAFWIGRCALSTAARMIDGRMPRAPFLDRLLDRIAVEKRDSPLGVLNWYYGQKHRRSACAAIASHVDELATAEDDVACSILDKTVEELFAHAVAAGHSTGEAGRRPWSYAGGVFSSVYVRRALERLMGSPAVPPRHSPVEGGLVWAARLAGWAVNPSWVERMQTCAEGRSTASGPSAPNEEFTVTSQTKQTIFNQFCYWRKATPVEPLAKDRDYVIIGCGTSYNLAMALAATFTEQGIGARAVPAGEWLARRGSYQTDTRSTTVIALSRSGETTETVRAALESRRTGIPVLGITCATESSLAAASSSVIRTLTDPAEGIVMTTSASLMLLLGLRLAGITVTGRCFEAAQAMLTSAHQLGAELLRKKSQFVFLGGGALYGIAVEGALKLQEMSLSHTQAFHPLEYRHGPISLIDTRAAVMMLYHPDTCESEAELVAELRSKGATVIGLGGPGDVSFETGAPASELGLVYLPALQLIGEFVAEDKKLDTTAPRHLTKVVVLT
jgi:glutamine---fructose-6-phosphate transaminase (isomerizing)